MSPKELITKIKANGCNIYVLVWNFRNMHIDLYIWGFSLVVRYSLRERKVPSSILGIPNAKYFWQFEVNVTCSWMIFRWWGLDNAAPGPHLGCEDKVEATFFHKASGFIHCNWMVTSIVLAKWVTINILYQPPFFLGVFQYNYPTLLT